MKKTLENIFIIFASDILHSSVSVSVFMFNFSIVLKTKENYIVIDIGLIKALRGYTDKRCLRLRCWSAIASSN